MTLLGRSVIRTTGYIGAPGINVIHWSAGLGPGPSDTDGVDEFNQTLQAMIESYLDIIPSEITISIDPDVPYFDASDGVLLGVTTDPGTPRSYSGTSSLLNGSRAVQLVCRHRTDAFVNGRRLQGRTFIGPISGDAIDNDGQIENAWRNETLDSWSGLISGLGGRLAVWHRPTFSGFPPVSNNDGSYADVTSVTANATPGTLRSRKT